MGRRPKIVYENNYMSLERDGTIGLSDGVGYVDKLEPEETKKLFDALFAIFVED